MRSVRPRPDPARAIAICLVALGATLLGTNGIADAATGAAGIRAPRQQTDDSTSTASPTPDESTSTVPPTTIGPASTVPSTTAPPTSAAPTTAAPTTAAPTTAAAHPTSAGVAGAGAAPPAAGVARSTNDRLAHTGAADGLLLAVGLGMVASGILLLRSRRRWVRSPDPSG